MTDYIPTRPSQFRSAELHSFADLVDHVMECFDVDSGDQHLRRSIRCSMDAYREIASMHDWSFFDRQGQVITVADSAVTLTYDHTGGSSERLVTLSSGTFPTDAEWYWVKVGNASYQIAKFLSSTTAQLDVRLNPGDDLASTAGTLVRYEYPLPMDFIHGQQLMSVDRSWIPQYVDPVSFAREYASSSNPSIYTIARSANHHGVSVVEFGASHNVARTYEFRYVAQPRPVMTFGPSPEYSTGTVAVSDATVTGTGTAWTSRMVGCIFRVSSNIEPPSGMNGSKRSYNPFTEQRVVVDVASPTSLTVDSAFDSVVAGKGHSISDPLDIEPISMLRPLRALAEYRFAGLKGDPSSTDQRSVLAAKNSMWVMALAEGMAADHRNRGHARGAGSGYAWSPYLIEIAKSLTGRG